MSCPKCGCKLSGTDNYETLDYGDEDNANLIVERMYECAYCDYHVWREVYEE